MTTAMVALCVLLIGFAAYYLGVVARRPQLIYQANAHNAELLARLPRLTRRFWATPWAVNGHLQIFVAGIQEALSPRLVYDRVEMLRMSDGGTTALHWHCTGIALAWRRLAGPYADPGSVAHHHRYTAEHACVRA